MSEIRSNYTVAAEHADGIKAAAAAVEEDVPIQEDGATHLAVNTNSTALHDSTKKMICKLAEQIDSDGDQIKSIAAQFQTIDRKAATEVGP